MNISEIEKTHREMAFLFHQTYLLNLVIGFTLTAISFTLSFTLDTSTAYLFVPLFGIYASISSYLLLIMNPIGDTGNPNIGIFTGKRGISEALISIYQMSSIRKWKTIYLLPYHISWGLIHSLWVYYLLGSVIGDTHFELGGMALLNSIVTFLYAIIDKKYLSPFSSSSLTTPSSPSSSPTPSLFSRSTSLLSSSFPPSILTSLTSPALLLSHNTTITTTATPTSNKQKRNQTFLSSSPYSNHLLPLFLGGVGYISIGILLLFVDIQYKRSSSLWILSLITVLHGFIRSICENNMIATLADYFPQKETTAYLIMGTVKTFSCGVCFLGFESVSF